MMYQQGQQLGLIFTHKFTLVAGVILPAISVTVEATTHVCSQLFFNPIPSSWHLLLVILTPLAQLQVWFAIRRNDPNRLKLAGLANAAAIGISLVYSIIYLPLIPFAALTVLIVLGFLPLAPYFSLLTALIMRKQLRRLAATAPQRQFPLTTKGLLASLGITLAVIGLIELPAIITRHGLRMAASASPETRTEGIRFLRAYGSKEYMLQSCYDQKGLDFNPFGELFSRKSPVADEQAREIYYRVTGETFDASPPPRSFDGGVIRQNDFEWDEAGRTPVLKGLSLISSNLDGSVDADGGVGNLVWTLGFENATYSQKEARAEIQLPPGAVVSSVTHSVDDIEREAEFTGRGPILPGEGRWRDVRSNRVLVTTAGRDRILVQCYPVPPFRNAIRIRIGITVPLVLQTKDQARLVLPHFTNRNFRIPPHLKHLILIDSTHPLNSDWGLAVQSAPRQHGGYQLWGEFSNADLMRPETALRLARIDSDHGIWSHNPFEVDGSIVKQSIEERKPVHLRRIVLVLDTSASMADWLPQISTAIRVIPADIDLKVVPADAEWLYESERNNFIVTGSDGWWMLLNSVPFVGGADNAPALSKAWDLATETPGNNSIVWIHSPQRMALESIEPLTRRLESRFYGPSLYSVQTSVGSDEIEKKLDGFNEVKSVVRLGSLRSDLERLFGQLSGQVPNFEFVRSVKHPQPEPDAEGLETSDHLARLWANDEVARILSARDDSLLQAASMLALRYQLVTPASGAVVQEYPEQFESDDLKPLETPYLVSIFEPDFASLFFVAFLFFTWLIYAKVCKANTGTI